jgi:hypothetical protein
MEIDIRPEPTEEERAAIVAALAQEDTKPLPAPWQEDEAEPVPLQHGTRCRRARVLRPVPLGVRAEIEGDASR